MYAMLVAFGLALLPLPLLIPGRWLAARFILALAIVIVIIKLWDIAVDVASGRPPTAGAVLRFFGNPFILVRRERGVERQPSAVENRLELAGSIAANILIGGAGVLAIRFDWTKVPFLVEHAVKASGAFIWAVALFHGMAAVTRLLGGYVMSPGEAPLLARTPAEFWRRYNRIMSRFLQVDVFGPSGGRRHPVRGTLVAFLVSGVLHEYMFSIAVGRLQGYQLAFFLVQGLGVALTLRLRPAGLSAAAWMVATFLFNLFTSLLFFYSADEIVPFYTQRG